MRAVGYQHPASLDHPQHSLDSQELPDPQDLLNSQHLADPEYQLSPEYLVDPKYLVDPEYLVDIELPDPSPGADDLLVRVEAVAVNPVDVKVRRRELPPPGAWRLLGWDAVGRVEALGQRAGGFAVGDRVLVCRGPESSGLQCRTAIGVLAAGGSGARIAEAS